MKTGGTIGPSPLDCTLAANRSAPTPIPTPSRRITPHTATRLIILLLRSVFAATAASDISPSTSFHFCQNRHLDGLDDDALEGRRGSDSAEIGIVV